MKTIDFSYFIERYNSGEMNEPERTWFEKELNSNNDLRKEVELRKKTDKILEQQSVMQLRNKLASIERTRSVPGPSTKPVKHVTLRYAAVFTGLIIIGSLILLSRKPLTTDEIFGKYYSAYEATTSTRSFQSNLNTDFATAIDYYNVHDYRNAALYFSKVLQNNPRDMKSTMLYGVSNFEESNYPEAEKSFRKVTTANDNMYLEDAEWYLALCYIRTNDTGKAVDQLSGIKNSKSIYSKRAGKILRNIR